MKKEINERYEKHKKLCRDHQRGAGYISQRARTEAIKLLIRKYREEFDRLVENLKIEMEEAQSHQSVQEKKE